MLQTVFKHFLPASHDTESPKTKGDDNDSVTKFEIIDEGDTDTKVKEKRRIRSEGDDGNEAAVLPTGISTTVSALVGDRMKKQEMIEVSSSAFPSLTLSVVQSNLKLAAAASSVQASIEKDLTKNAASSLCSEKDAEQSHKKVAPLLPTFAQTLDPKLMPGYSSSGFLGGKPREKNWKLPLFKSRRKMARKEYPSQSSATKEPQENPSITKHKNSEGTA